MSTRIRTRGQRGSALLVAMVLMGILLMMVAGLMLYSNQQRIRATSAAKTSTRLSCAEAGLQLARNYFGRNQALWDTFLAAPTVYNPVASGYNTAPATPTVATFQTAHPELFMDLDNDGLNDVFIFVRDNADESLPSAQNYARDNDQNVIIGSTCISSTLVPKFSDGTPDPDALVVESLLSYNLGADKDCNGARSENCNKKP